MALSSKERAALRAEAHHLTAAVHVGHHGLTDTVRQSVDDALRTRELVKIQFTKNGVAFGAPSLWIENNNTFEAASVTIPAQVSLVAGDVIRLSFTAVSGPCQVFTGYGNLTGYKI